MDEFVQSLAQHAYLQSLLGITTKEEKKLH